LRHRPLFYPRQPLATNRKSPPVGLIFVPPQLAYQPLEMRMSEPGFVIRVLRKGPEK
jgi:hypothetical protein